MRRDGGWTVELATAIIGNSGAQIVEINIRPPDMEQVIRFGQGRYPSTMSLLAELTGVPEMVLRTLVGRDGDRVLRAYYEVVPDDLKKIFTDAKMPLATPDELMPIDQNRLNDPIDPRFPRADGPVRRMGDFKINPPPPEPAEPTDGPGLDPGLTQPVRKVI
jgi:hypothetical protein